MTKVRSKKTNLLLAGVLMLGLLIGSFAFAWQKPVTINVDGQSIDTKVVFTCTVEDALNENQIVLGERDKVEPSQDTVITRDMQINVIRAFPVKVLADGVIREVLTTPITAQEAVALAGFQVGENDIVKTLPVEAPQLGPQMGVEVVRVSQQEIILDQEVPFAVETTADANLEKGMSKTVQTGKNGVARTTYLVTYHNGQEADRQAIKVETVAQPQNQVVAVGSLTTVSRGGQRFDFSEARTMQSTAYTYTGNRTATGKSPAVGMVAVDPAVIPLGSKMYIEGYGYAFAEDTGGAIRGNKVDVFMENYSQCVQWGRKNVKVYLIP